MRISEGNAAMGAEDKAPAPQPEKPAVPEEPPASFWLVVVKDEADAAPLCVRCENAEALTKAIESNVLESTAPLHAFAFKGRRIQLSAPRPVCSFKVGDKKVDVGRESDEYDEGGRIVPLTRSSVDG